MQSNSPGMLPVVLELVPGIYQHEQRCTPRTGRPQDNFCSLWGALLGLLTLSQQSTECFSQAGFLYQKAI